MSAKRESDLELLAEAEALLARAHNPYSGVAVAALVVTADGRIFPGVNVENTSLGLTVCAERNALAAAVAAGAAGKAAGPGTIATIVFTSNNDAVRRPCGACCQVIAELAPTASILFGRAGAIERAWDSIDALLPDAFDGTWKKDAR